jgi:hypothetical protein
LISALVFANFATFARGTIKFNTRLTGQVDAAVSVEGQGAGSWPGAMAQLYLIPPGGGPAMALTPATTFRTTSAAAMFYGNEPLTGVIVPGAPAGSTVNIQLRAWAGGTSYETATEWLGRPLYS